MQEQEQQDLEHLLKQYDASAIAQHHSRSSPASLSLSPAKAAFSPPLDSTFPSSLPLEQHSTGAHPHPAYSPSFPPDLSPNQQSLFLPANLPLHSQQVQLEGAVFEFNQDHLSFGTPSYAGSHASSASDLAAQPQSSFSPAPSIASSFGQPDAYDTRCQPRQDTVHGQYHPVGQPEQLQEDPLLAGNSLQFVPSSMTADVSMSEAQTTEAGSGQGATGRGAMGVDRDATIALPRRSDSLRQDTQRPFGYKRSSSGFSSFLNYAASPTSDLRTTRPSTPAESATRSTFGETLSDSPLTSAVPNFGGSPAPVLSLEIPTAPALQLTGPTPQTAKPKDRPKGRGTLELERVLGMWAAKTPTSSFPNLPPLSSSSSVPSSSQPLFTQTIVSSEPESFVPAPSSQPDPFPPSSSSAGFGGFDQSQPSPAPQQSSFDSLAPPLSPPRRQRSKSETDIMAFPDAAQSFPLDFAQRYLPSFAQQQTQPPLHPSQMGFDASVGVWRPPSAPSAYTTATPQLSSLNIENEQLQHEMSRPHRPSLSRPRQGAGGPGYHEAAFLDVPGSQRRGAKAQGLGHRRSAKSDDFSHLFSPTSSSYPHIPLLGSTADGSAEHSIPPQVGGEAQQHHAPPSPALQQSSYPSHPSQSLVTGYLANGQPVLVPASYLSSDPSTASAAQYLAASASQSGGYNPYQPQLHPSYPAPHPHPHQSALHQQYANYYPLSSSLPASAAAAALAHQRGSISSSAGGSAYSHSGHGSPLPHHAHAHAHPQANPSPPTYPLPPSAAAGAAAALPPLPPPGPGSAYGPQRTPYVYHSPVPAGGGLVGLPSPPMTAGMSHGGSPASRSGSETGFLGGASPGIGGFMGEDGADGSVDGGGGGGSDYASPYYDGVEDRKPRLSKSSKGKKRASVSGGSGGGLGGKMGGDEEGSGEEFSKESKTTQATIEAAKRRRNKDAVAKFVCELCGETFTRRYNLRGHQRAHRNEKPYKCSYDGCDKAFARAHDCKRHELLHLGVRKYHCSPCKRDFVRLDALHRHHRSEVGQTCVRQLEAEGHTFDEKGSVIL
ncbi:hypothetical protein JCM11641_005944 [Rhodosporidiobolus odoratus]